MSALCTPINITALVFADNVVAKPLANQDWHLMP